MKHDHQPRFLTSVAIPAHLEGGARLAGYDRDSKSFVYMKVGHAFSLSAVSGEILG